MSKKLFDWEPIINSIRNLQNDELLVLEPKDLPTPTGNIFADRIHSVVNNRGIRIKVKRQQNGFYLIEKTGNTLPQKRQMLVAIEKIEFYEVPQEDLEEDRARSIIISYSYGSSKRECFLHFFSDGSIHFASDDEQFTADIIFNRIWSQLKSKIIIS